MRVSERWTARAATLDPASLLDRAGGSCFTLLYGGGERGRYTVYGEEPLARCHSADFEEPAFARSGDLPPFFPDLIGLATYEWGSSAEPLVPPAPASPIGVPGLDLVLYGRVLVHDRARGLLHEGERSLEGGVGRGFSTAGAAPSLLDQGGAARPFAARKVGDSEEEAGYRAKVGAIREAIAAGSVYQVNLTRQEEWEYRGDLRGFARELWAANPAPYSAFIAAPGYCVASASPERLVGLRAGRLESRPIKGTAPRGATEEEDRALAAALLASEKDRAELAMIVDLVRNDLARCSLPGTTEVEAFPVLESYANVHHLVATVSSRFDRVRGLAGLLAALFPGGSITGCPKIAAMRMIRDLEPWPRSVYTGSIGWVTADLSALDLNIAIRTVWADGSRLRFGVGGAVVWDSEPAAEYLETVHKARSILSCLNSARARW